MTVNDPAVEVAEQLFKDQGFDVEHPERYLRAHDGGNLVAHDRIGESNSAYCGRTGAPMSYLARGHRRCANCRRILEGGPARSGPELLAQHFADAATEDACLPLSLVLDALDRLATVPPETLDSYDEHGQGRALILAALHAAAVDWADSPARYVFQPASVPVPRRCLRPGCASVAGHVPPHRNAEGVALCPNTKTGSDPATARLRHQVCLRTAGHYPIPCDWS